MIRQCERDLGNGVVNSHLEKVLAMRAQRTCVMARHKLGVHQTGSKDAGKETPPNTDKYHRRGLS